MRILLLRPYLAGLRTARHLETKGHRVLLSPLTHIVPIQQGPPEGWQEARAYLATSAHAFEAARIHVPPLPPLPLFCVGQRSARAALERGLVPVDPIPPDAQTLLTYLQTYPITPLLYLAGRDRKPILERGLREGGWPVFIWETYQAKATRGLTSEAIEALRGGAIDAILHYSHRHTALFVQHMHATGLLESLPHLQHFCLSEDVASPLRDYISSWNHIDTL